MSDTVRKKTPAAIWMLRANELEAELKQCKENGARTHMDVAEKLSEIAGWKGRAEELEGKLKKAKDSLLLFRRLHPSYASISGSGLSLDAIIRHLGVE